MHAHRPAQQSFLRGLLRRLKYEITAPRQKQFAEPFDAERLRTSEQALRTMPTPDAGAKAYLEKHIPRLARTLALVPPPHSTGRALELGCYMQITPLLDRICGYREVRGAYYGPPGRIDKKTLPFPDGDFACFIDHFDAERDPFPYPDGHFDLVMAGEIIEHMTYDPMHLLVESRRVLSAGGCLVLTTPNVGSVTSVAKTLDGRDNPQIFYLYKRPIPGEEAEIGHVREYTAYEIGEAVKAAGFELRQLFTTFIDEYSMHRPMLEFLRKNGFSTENRGEQTWCVAVKAPSAAIDRYPFFLYT